MKTITIKEEVKLPGTNIILEKGDKIRVLDIQEDTTPFKSISFTGGGSSTTFYLVFTDQEQVAASSDRIHVGWNEWKRSSKRDTSDEDMKHRLIRALTSSVTQMSQNVDINLAVKNARTFEDKVDAVLRITGKKLTKAGVKTTKNLFKTAFQL